MRDGAGRVRFPREVPDLAGDAVRLRALNEDDIPAWFARATDAESAAMAGDPIPASIEEGFAWLQRHRDRFAMRTGIRWAIVPTTSQESIGTVGLALRDEASGAAELGIVVARAWWGRGVGTEAAKLVTRYAFAEMGQREIRAELLASNAASRRLLEKNGFAFERVIPDFDTSQEGSVEGMLYVLRRAREST